MSIGAISPAMPATLQALQSKPRAAAPTAPAAPAAAPVDADGDHDGSTVGTRLNVVA